MNSEIQLFFDEVQHKYYDNTGAHYTSVTQFIDKFKPKFDELYWATKKAQERGVPVGQVLNEWAIIRNNSCERGSNTHNFLEDNINVMYEGTATSQFKDILERSKNQTYKYKITNEVELYSSPIREKLPTIYVYLMGLIRQGFVLFAEKRVFSFKYKIAGTIDLLAVRGNEFLIVDWKTNKEDLKFTSGYYKKVNGVKTNQWVSKQEYFDYPLNNLMNCKGIIYTLQLSLYSYLVELHGMKNVGCSLFHIINNDFENVKKHKIEYLKQDVHRVLEFHFKQNVKPKYAIE